MEQTYLRGTDWDERRIEEGLQRADFEAALLAVLVVELVDLKVALPLPRG